MASLASKIKERVDELQDVCALINILKHIPLQSVKTLINQHVSCMEENELRTTYLTSFPMDHIVSADALQHVVSFLPHQRSIKAINTTFREAVKKQDAVSVRTSNTNAHNRLRVHMQKHLESWQLFERGRNGEWCARTHIDFT